MKPIISYENLTIYQYDIDTLNIGSWINDVIIHYFGIILENTYNQENQKFKFIPPCTVQYIRFEDIELVKKINNDNNFFQNFQIIFFPITNGTSYINTGNHWSLLVLEINFEKTKFYHYDSLGSNIDIAKKISKRIKNIFNFKKSRFENINCPKQENGYDCGVYLMCYAKKICENNGELINCINTINQNDVTEFRKNFKKQLINK